MSYWTEKIKIGTIEVPRFIGGPLDGITDAPFRQLVREFSRDALLYTEMRHVACISHERGARLALDFQEIERPLNFQIAANSEQFIDQACERILAKGVDMVDLNVGCPARNVVKNCSGSALMGDLPRLQAILRRLRAALPVPFTVKIRAGFKQKNAVEVAKLIQDCGADALSIHPRLQTQLFSGRPDYLLAAEVKRAVTIPVFFSGGVINWATARMTYEQTGVDGFLIGRGMWSKPWKLLELEEHARGNQFSVTSATVITYAIKHLDKMVAHYGLRGLFCFRKHLPFYLRGFASASAIREKLVASSSVDEVKDTLTSLLG